MIASQRTVHTRPEIERLLRRSLVPRTDNRDALVELGFTPAYPQLAHDAYYGALWTRAIEVQSDVTAARRSELRMLVVERAFYALVDRRTRRLRLRGAGTLVIASRERRRLSSSRFVGAARVSTQTLTAR